MRVLRHRHELSALEAWRRPGPLVLVPTMGALHEGHLSLVRRGAELGPVVVTIFVNPTQFGPHEDFAAYPRDLEADLEMLRSETVAAVFAPEVSEIYGDEGEVTVRPGRRARGLCGSDRPDHFGGVLTVVAKLFGLVCPDVAVFGRKDAQQCLVIGQMVDDLKLGIRLVDAPTVRDADGLAMSSRNRYLDVRQREQALCLRRALLQARELLESGERRRERVEAVLAQKLRAAGGFEYAVVRDVPELTTPNEIAGTTLLAVAARVGPARLIDNEVVHVGPQSVVSASLLGGPDPLQT